PQSTRRDPRCPLPSLVAFVQLTLFKMTARFIVSFARTRSVSSVRQARAVEIWITISVSRPQQSSVSLGSGEAYDATAPNSRPARVGSEPPPVPPRTRAPERNAHGQAQRPRRLRPRGPRAGDSGRRRPGRCHRDGARRRHAPLVER